MNRQRIMNTFVYIFATMTIGAYQGVKAALFEYKNQAILLYNNNQKSSAGISKVFEKFNINFQETQSLDPQDDSHLYLIFNVANIPSESLPPYYIAYNTEKFKKASLNEVFFKKLSNAIVVWDCSWENINIYRTSVPHYYYFPENYEYADPVILSCFLPLNTLSTYKEMVTYSNSVNSDISSHLPTIFALSVLQKADIIIEAGVRGGESTRAFEKSLNFYDGYLVGLDIEASTSQVYSKIKNSLFITMDDLAFPQYYRSQPALKNHALDIIFIDTSHYYDHTLNEIRGFVPVLANNGFLLFHDSYMSPLPNFQWYCMNGAVFGNGWDNQQGVTRAIKDYFSISFDQTKYNNFEFVKDGTVWHFIHYPFSNGLTLIKKLS